MADQYTLATQPDIQQLQTFLDWQCILDQLLDQSSVWESGDLGSGSGGPKEPELVVANNIDAPSSNF